MSRLALEVERQVREIKSKAAKERRGKGQTANKEANVVAGDGFFNQDEGGDGKELTGDSNSGMTDTTNLSQQEGAATGGNDAAGAKGKAEGKKTDTMAKKSTGGKKAAKADKKKAVKPAAKAAKTPGERKPREKKVASGKLKKIEASGTTYLTLEFEEGSITLTPTGNREQNRDIAVKALRGLL